MMMTLRSITILLLLQSSLLFQTCHASYAITLAPGEVECFHVRGRIDQASIVTGSFDLLNDAVSGDSFSAHIADSVSSKELWKSKEAANEGSFHIVLQKNQRIVYCLELDETIDDVIDEAGGLPVGFTIHVQPTLQRTLPQGEDGPDAQRAMELVQQAEHIHGNWRLLLDHFDFLRNREAQHSVLTSQILSRVMGWTLLEALLVVGMATCQVLYWKKFFEQRRYL